MRRTEKIARGLLAAVVIAAVLGLTGEGFYRLYLVPPDPPDAPCPTTRAGGEIPGGSRVAKSAKPFAGPGPHPLVLVLVENERLELSADRDLGVLPAGSLAAEDDHGRPVGAQLVVCRYRLPDPPVRIAPCRYSDEDKRITQVEVLAPWFEYQVRLATTGAPVTTFKDSSGGLPCPEFVRADTTSMTSEPGLPELAPRLQALVTTPR